jgi:hypothetical protein
MLLAKKKNTVKQLFAPPVYCYQVLAWNKQQWKLFALPPRYDVIRKNF